MYYHLADSSVIEVFRFKKSFLESFFSKTVEVDIADKKNSNKITVDIITGIYDL